MPGQLPRILPPVRSESEIPHLDEEDLLSRRHFAEGLKRLLLSTQEPMVVLLDGPWGSGKTHFLSQFSGLMSSDCLVVYFDAFRHDHSNDPLAALMADFLSSANAAPGSVKNQIVQDVIFGAGQILARTALRVGLGLATGGLFQSNDVGGVLERVGSATGDVADEMLSKHIERLSETAKCIESFKEKLRTAAAETPSGRILFIVDELDRCKPSFAIDTLEALKHTLRVDGVKFLIGTNLTEFKKSVRHTYGQDIDAEMYLHKFVDIRVRLPESVPMPNAGHRSVGFVYLRHLWDRMGFDDFMKEKHPNFIDVLARLVILNNLQLRDIERLLSRFAMCLLQLKPGHFCNFALLADLCYLDVFDGELLAKLRDDRAGYSEVAKRLKLTTEIKISSRFPEQAFSIKIWKAALQPADILSDNDQSVMELQYELQSVHNIDPSKLIMLMAESYLTPGIEIY